MISGALHSPREADVLEKLTPEEITMFLRLANDRITLVDLLPKEQLDEAKKLEFIRGVIGRIRLYNDKFPDLMRSIEIFEQGLFIEKIPSHYWAYYQKQIHSKMPDSYDSQEQFRSRNRRSVTFDSPPPLIFTRKGSSDSSPRSLEKEAALKKLAGLDPRVTRKSTSNPI